MITPEERYLNDPQYKQMVDVLEGMIHQCHFTPSEIREIAMLACIKHEMRVASRSFTISAAEKGEEYSRL